MTLLLVGFLIVVLITIEAFRWKLERQQRAHFRRLFDDIADAGLLLNDAIDGLDRRLKNQRARIQHLERSLVEKPQAWVDALATAERTRPQRPVESLDEEAERVQPHDQSNELSAVRLEAEAETDNALAKLEGLPDPLPGYRWAREERWPNHWEWVQVSVVTGRTQESDAAYSGLLFEDDDAAYSGLMFEDGEPAPAEVLRTAVDYGTVLEAGLEKQQPAENIEITRESVDAMLGTSNAQVIR